MYVVCTNEIMILIQPNIFPPDLLVVRDIIILTFSEANNIQFDITVVISD